MPGGSKLCFGVFQFEHLQGALILGAGPYQAHRLVDGAISVDCLSLTRLWLSDQLPPNSESRVLGIVLRAIKKHTDVKFLVTYADPGQGHRGGIYMATGWLYTGLSEAMPLYDIGDGQLHHSRSLSHAYGTHSMRYFHSHGVHI